jgi:alginate biosynthesis protein AlgX
MIRLAAVLAALWAGAAAAQSTYGCLGLDDRHAYAAVEGDAGTFFLIDPDLRMFHPLTEEAADAIAGLSAALAVRGTTLVYAPLPTKSLALPERLPQAAFDYGLNPDLAATFYDLLLDRLRSRDIAAADLRRAMRAQDGAPSFHLADHRITPSGATRIAAALGQVIATAPGFKELPRAQFTTTATGTVTLDSDMRAALQRHCQIRLPEVMAEGSTTTRAGGTSTGTDLFSSAATTGGIVIVTTDKAGEPTANLAGAVAKATGLDTQIYAVPQGGSYAAISSYMTSRIFQERRPAFVVWLNPVEENLSDRGDQPMAELVAAATGDCGIPLPMTPGIEVGTLSADLSSLDLGRGYTLLVESEGSAAFRAQFDFRGPDGTIRTRQVLRHRDQAPTGRFYMPLTGLWPEGARSVEVILDVPVSAGARVSACANPGEPRP